jgi:hypothetical protein
MQLPEPWSALFAYFVVFPVTLFLTTKLTKLVIKDPLILKVSALTMVKGAPPLIQLGVSEVLRF